MAWEMANIDAEEDIDTTDSAAQNEKDLVALHMRCISNEKDLWPERKGLGAKEKWNEKDDKKRKGFPKKSAVIVLFFQPQTKRICQETKRMAKSKAQGNDTKYPRQDSNESVKTEAIS